MATILIYEIKGNKNGKPQKTTLERAYRPEQGDMTTVIESDKLEIVELWEYGSPKWTDVQVNYKGSKTV